MLWGQGEFKMDLSEVSRYKNENECDLLSDLLIN